MKVKDKNIRYTYKKIIYALAGIFRALRYISFVEEISF